jgi:hypothetical protein
MLDRYVKRFNEPWFQNVVFSYDAMLVIADAERAVAIAGVMGGANSEVTPQTTRCFSKVCILFILAPEHRTADNLRQLYSALQYCQRIIFTNWTRRPAHFFRRQSMIWAKAHRSGPGLKSRRLRTGLAPGRSRAASN